MKVFTRLLLLIMILATGSKLSAQAYCTPSSPSFSSGYNMGFTNVTFGSINNSSTTAVPYTNYTNTIGTNVFAATTMSYSVTLGNGGNGQSYRIWIDWNGDSTFAASELVVNYVGGSGDYGVTKTGTITIPCGMTAGTRRMRLAADFYGIGTMAGPCTFTYAEVEDYRINYIPVTGTNVGNPVITSSLAMQVGNNPLSINFLNLGNTTVDSCYVGYQLSGYAPVVQKLTGLALASCALQSHTFATQLNIPAIGSYVLKVWASKANGLAGPDVPTDDTLSLNICTSLSGSYTINPSGTGTSNYTSFSAAAAALSNCGIVGPVTFTVAAGTYNESVILNPIPGASATNTITFDGVDSATRKVIFNTTNATFPAIFNFNGADYVTIRNLGIWAQGTTVGVGVMMMNQSDYNRVKNCNIRVSENSTSSNCYGIGICASSYSTGGNTGNYDVFENNVVIGGYVGGSMMGTSSSTFCQGNVFRGNRFTNMYYMGMYLYYQNNDSITDNFVRFRSGTTINYGAYMYYNNQVRFERNNIQAAYMGLYAYFCNQTGPGRMAINNNILVTSGVGYNYSYSLYGYYCYNSDFYHNTVVSNPGSSVTYAYNAYISYGTNMNIRNNIFYNNVQGTNSYSLYVPSTSGFTAFDYNYHYSAGTKFTYWGTAQFDLAGLKTAGGTTYHQKSISGVPNFVNTTAGAEDYHLTSSIPAQTGDGSVGVAVDVDNEPRCLIAPTIGADESKFVIANPVAGYTVGTVYVNSSALFLNNNPASMPMTHKWYVDGVFITANNNLTYTFTTTGNHTVTIVSRNCAGVDSLITTVNVVTPTNAPVSDFIADITVVNTYQNIKLTDLSSNGPTSWQWTISPGVINTNWAYTSGTTASSQNPVIYFITPGTYSICLKASNVAGQGNNRCKTSYIVVQAAQSMCIYPFSTNVPLGNLYSSGGPTGGYGQNENCTFTIDACADSTFLNVTAANFGTGTVDRVEIYEGLYVSGKTPVASFVASGSYNLPTTIGVKGKMTVREVTDATSNNGTGIKASWFIKSGTFAAPTGTIVGDNNAYYCNSGIFNFYSSSFRDPDYLYEWDFDNDGFIDWTGMDGQFMFGQLGPDSIKLKISGCGGTLNLFKVVNVIAPPTPTAAFTSNTVAVTSSDTIYLADASTGGVTNWTWTVTGPGSPNFVGGTNANSRNPKLICTIGGCYTVKLKVSNCTGADSTTKTCFFQILSYCQPTASNQIPDLSVSNFTLGSINNNITTPAPGTVDYRNFTQLYSTNMDRGATYPFSVTRPSNYNNANIKIWVDWNQDGLFNPVTELAASTITPNKTWTGNMTTPFTATLGATRLRIGVSYNNMSNTPCGANVYGEFQDYRVFVRPDVTAPVLYLSGPNPTSLEIGRTYTEVNDSAIDAVNGNLTDSISYSGYITGRGYQQPITQVASALGTYTITASVSDFSGNVTTKQRTVIVTPDVTKPVITLNGTNPMYVEVYTSFVDPGATATDFFFTNPLTVNQTNNVDTSKLGSYTVTYTATDINGNAAVPVTRTVIVRDSQKPVITFPAGTDTIYVEVRTNYVDPGATVTDNYWTPVLPTITGSVNTYVPGTYTYTFNAVDGSGNAATPKVRVIIVRDATAPTLVLAAPASPDTLVLEVNAYTSVPEPGYVAQDNYYSSSQITVSRTGSVNLNKLGIYTLTYVATDPSGNSSAPAYRIYKIVDRTKPVITLIGATTVNTCRWKAFTDPGVTVTDNYNVNLVPTTSTNLDVNLPGIYYIKYDAVDSSGNVAATVLRYINVQNCATGVTTTTGENNINVTPNPSSGKINVEISLANQEKGSIAVYNSVGKLVRVINPDGTLQTHYDLDLSNEASGIYFITVKTEGNTYTHKFVLNK